MNLTYSLLIFVRVKSVHTVNSAIFKCTLYTYCIYCHLHNSMPCKNTVSAKYINIMHTNSINALNTCMRIFTSKNLSFTDCIVNQELLLNVMCHIKRFSLEKKKKKKLEPLFENNATTPSSGYKESLILYVEQFIRHQNKPLKIYANIQIQCKDYRKEYFNNCTSSLFELALWWSRATQDL